MKKMMLVAIGLIIGMAGFSQFSIGVQAIGNLSTASIKNDQNIDFTKKSMILPGGGIVAQYDFSEKLSLRTGVNYLQHGIKLNATIDPDVTAKAENKLHYLQLPVNVLYNFPVGNSKIYAGAGGFINYGISGESLQTVRERDNDGTITVTTEKLKAFKKEADNGAGLKKVDAGVGALAGIRLDNGIFANVGYQLSLTNSSDDNGKYKNRGLQLSVGCFF